MGEECPKQQPHFRVPEGAVVRFIEPDDYFPPPVDPEADARWLLMCEKLGNIVADLYFELGRRVADAMTEVGEDPKNMALFRIRVGQAAYSINSQAERARDQR